MGYADVERLFCKITASNDIISQGACWISFEQNYPPGSQAFEDLLELAFGLAVLFAIILASKARRLRNRTN